MAERLFGAADENDTMLAAATTPHPANWQSQYARELDASELNANSRAADGVAGVEIA